MIIIIMIIIIIIIIIIMIIIIMIIIIIIIIIIIYYYYYELLRINIIMVIICNHRTWDLMWTSQTYWWCVQEVAVFACLSHLQTTITCHKNGPSKCCVDAYNYSHRVTTK
jgi:hypothetical protein